MHHDIDVRIARQSRPAVASPHAHDMVDSTGLLSADRISTNALKVVRRLTEHGYQAYLVGGCVRDLLLGKTPKDFDVATDAHPEEVRDLFRNSRLIGRRFRIVHVTFGHEIVEVATFRAAHGEEESQRRLSEGGMILSDNVYGTFDEDVHRRDFAMNALYYQPETGSLIDEVEGLDDIRHHRIRLIGDPGSRFREDPVRMLRAIRFKTKLGFAIDDGTEQALLNLGYLLQDIPPARLFEEVLKLFMNGHGAASFESLVDHNLFGWLFPDSRRLLVDGAERKLILLALINTDLRVAGGKPVTPAFVFAALLWYPFLEEKTALEAEGYTSVIAGQEAASRIIARQLLFTSIPRRFSGPMREVWHLQERFMARFGRRPDTLLHHKRFRAAYDFMVVRQQSGEDLDELVDWWTAYQEAGPEARHELVRAAGGKPKRRRRRGSRRRKLPQE